MSVEVERSFEVDASIEDVWAAISDPGFRAGAISVVESYTVRDDHTVWRLKLPIRFVPGSIRVRTRDVESEAPRFVRFVGESKVMRVEGEHEITPIDGGGSRVRNRFVVDGKMPGVETFFRRNFDDEVDNLFAAVENATGEAE